MLWNFLNSKELFYLIVGIGFGMIMIHIIVIGFGIY